MWGRTGGEVHNDMRLFIVLYSPACPVWGCTGGEVHNDMRLYIVHTSPACPVWGCTGGEVHNDTRLCLLCPISQLALCGDVLEVKFIMT